MTTQPDDLVVTGPTFTQKAADNLYVTPSGGTQNLLANLINGGTLSSNANLLQFGSFTPAGTALANATVINAANCVLGAAASTTGVALPAASTVIGYPILIMNKGTAVVNVYGQGGDTIDTIAGTTGVKITNAYAAVFLATASGTWQSGLRGTVSS